MADLTGKTVKATYKDLLQVSNSNSGIDATRRTVEDGEGTSSVLQLSTTEVSINGLVYPTSDGTSGQAIVTDGAGGLSFTTISGGGGGDLGDLDDVTITSIASGEVLKWNGSAWINNTLAEAGVAASSHTHATSDITSGTFADARIAESNVTQHEAALTITESQISDLAHVTQEQIEDYVGAMFTGNTETLVTVTYQDVDGTVDVVVDNDLANYSNTNSAFITASSSDTLTNKGGNISQWTNDSGYVTATLTQEEVEDYAGALIGTGGTKTGITVTYQDTTGDVDFVVADLTVAGDSGSTGMTPGDTLTIAGGTNATTAMSGDTLTINVDDAFLANDGDTGTGVYDFGGATSLEIPNSATPTVNADGEVAVDTTVTDFSHGVMKYYGGEEMGVVAMPIAQFTSPTDEYVVSYNATNDEFELAAQGAGGGIDNVVEDTTPQLGADLDMNSYSLDTTTANYYFKVGGASIMLVQGINTVFYKDIKLQSGVDIVATNGFSLLGFSYNAGSAVNYIDIANNTTGNSPAITATGTDTNVGLTLDSKGTGTIAIGSADSVITLDGTSISGDVVLDEDDMVSDSATSLATQQSIKAYVDSNGGGINNVVEDTTPQLGGQLDVNGNAIGDGTRELLTFTEDASAVNHVNIENQATGSGPIISAAGDDANVDLVIDGKGSGDVVLASSNIDITGNIVVSGTVDGRDVATDGTKLDGIESNATADQTTEEIQDIAGPLVATGGTKTGIAITYQDATGDMDFVVSDTTVAGDTGSTAITPGDTLTIAGGTEITTAMSGDTLTVNADFTPDSTDTLTNKTFDANGTGNSLSNVDVADLANGTDGELITWDAAGAPATVSVGTSGHVLTSNGVGAAPTFQAASGGGDWTLVSSASASASSAITFTGLSSTYHVYKLIITGITASSDGYLRLRTSTNNGSSYDTDASDYAYMSQAASGNSDIYTAANVSDEATSAIYFNDTASSNFNIDSTAAEDIANVEITIFKPSDATFTHVIAHYTQWDTSATFLNHSFTSGARLSSADVDAIQIDLTAGNLDTGEFRLYGLSNA